MLAYSSLPEKGSVTSGAQLPSAGKHIFRVNLGPTETPAGSRVKAKWLTAAHKLHPEARVPAWQGGPADEGNELKTLGQTQQ